METAIYMKIPNLHGDVTEKNHKQWIRLSSLNFAARRKLIAEPGHIANRESTRPAITELTVTKTLDSASSLLFGESCTGKVHVNLLIDLCKTGSSGLSTIASFTLENVIVSGYHLDTATHSTSTTAMAPLEIITLSFDKIEMKTIPYGPQGEQHTPISYAYDMRIAAAA